METANDILADFVSPCGLFQLTFEDDGKVAYAYLKQGNAIVGDVWLYNRCPTPEEPEWKDRTKMPFANSRAFTRDEGHFRKSVALDDIRVEWQYENEQPTACLYLCGETRGNGRCRRQAGLLAVCFARWAARTSTDTTFLLIRGPDHAFAVSWNGSLSGVSGTLARRASRVDFRNSRLLESEHSSKIRGSS